VLGASDRCPFQCNVRHFLEELKKTFFPYFRRTEFTTEMQIAILQNMKQMGFPPHLYVLHRISRFMSYIIIHISFIANITNAK